MAKLTCVESVAEDPEWLVMSLERIDLSDIWRRWATGGMRASEAGSLENQLFLIIEEVN
jgi:hypothetical protein